MALLLRMKTRTRSPTLTNPSLLHHHLFSTSNSGGDGGEQSPPDFNSPFSSILRDVKSNLKKQSPSPSKSNPSSSTFSFPAYSKSQQTSLEEIMKNLSEFRRRTSVPTPDDPSSSQQISFQEIYKRNMAQKPGESAGAVPVKTTRQIPLDNIYESLQKMRKQKGVDRMSSSVLIGSLSSKPSDSEVIGGMSALPVTVFGKEMRERKERGGSSAAATNLDFLRTYGHHELGEKLRKLRPEGKGKEWFSLEELNERLMRLREMEEKKAMSNPTGAATMILRGAISQMSENKDDKSKKTSPQRIDMLGLLGGTPTYLTRPPKEHLVEKFFHPDNMSSAEKLKIELGKVRDEFKMSESDCGSARVQVAQLTTKIKHLSSVLHKKDVHSRKGLLAMVQRRKRLLKYLRRTDWDSYCLVISKLGLRDNPDHSYKGRSGVMTS